MPECLLSIFSKFTVEADYWKGHPLDQRWPTFQTSQTTSSSPRTTSWQPLRQSLEFKQPHNC